MNQPNNLAEGLNFVKELIESSDGWGSKELGYFE